MSKVILITRLCILAGLVLGSPIRAEMTPEAVFEASSEYTVRIKSRIEHPLGEDSAGAFSGTGFIVDAERGWIVTNRHVVGESPSDVSISRRGAPFQSARKLYVDPFVDIAVLEAQVKGAENADLACNRAEVGTGHPVGAYGHPWGLEYTGTQGVVSGRTTKWPVVMLQTDAPINSGNSGGPLISMRTGEILGVSTSKYNDENSENTNFAVPINDVCQILALLREGRDPSPPDLGVAFFNFEDRDAVVVAERFDGKDSLDLMRNDEIIAAGPDMEPVFRTHELINSLRGSLDNAQLRIIRNGEEKTLHGPVERQTIRNGIEFAGLVLAPFNFKDRSVTPVGHDIGIFSIAPGSRASGAGLKWFDLITKVNGEPVASLEHLFVLLSDLGPDERTSLEFLRVFENEHYFGYVQRYLLAQKPVWLDSQGTSEGLAVRLAWLADQTENLEGVPVEERVQTAQRIDRLLRSIDQEVSGRNAPDQAAIRKQLRTLWNRIEPIAAGAAAN